MHKLADLYARFRGSALFMLLLCGFVSAWVSGHIVFNIDPTWGMLNLCLSIEASISVAMLMIANEKQDRLQGMQEEWHRHQQEMHAENLKRIEKVIVTGQAQLQASLKMMASLDKSLGVIERAALNTERMVSNASVQAAATEASGHPV